MKNKKILTGIILALLMQQTGSVSGVSWNLGRWFSTPEQQKKSLSVVLMAMIGVSFFVWKYMKKPGNARKASLIVEDDLRRTPTLMEGDYGKARRKFEQGQDARGATTTGSIRSGDAPSVPSQMKKQPLAQPNPDDTGIGLGLGGTSVTSPTDADRKQQGSNGISPMFVNSNPRGNGDCGDSKPNAEQEMIRQQDLKKVKEPEISSDEQADRIFQTVLATLGRTPKSPTSNPFWALTSFFSLQENTSHEFSGVSTEDLHDCIRELRAIERYYVTKIAQLDETQQNLMRDSKITPVVTQKEMISKELARRSQGNRAVIVPSLMDLAKENDIHGVAGRVQSFIDGINPKFASNGIPRSECSDLRTLLKDYQEAVRLCMNNTFNLMARYNLTSDGYIKSLIQNFRRGFYRELLTKDPRSLYTIVANQLNIDVNALPGKSCDEITNLITAYIDLTSKEEDFRSSPEFYGIREAQTVLGDRFSKELYDAFCSGEAALAKLSIINDEKKKELDNNRARLEKLRDQLNEVEGKLVKLQEGS